MRTGIYSWFGFLIQLDERLRMIAGAGFQTTCLWFGHEEEMVAAGRADEMPELVRRHGLFLDNIHAPFHDMYRIWSDDVREREAVGRELAAAVDYCGRHGIPYVVMHPEGGKRRLPPNESGLELVRELVAAARHRQVTIAIENVHHDEYLDFLFEAIDSPGLGFCYDSGHEALSGTSGRLLERWGHRLVTTHLSDTLGQYDDHFLPGQGNIDWNVMTETLNRTGYDGVLMLEVDGPESAAGFKTPEEFLAAACESLMRLPAP